LFTRFFTHDGLYLCRVPFSVASLLEVRAMANEMFQLVGMTQEIKDNAVKTIEMNSAIEKANRRIFDATLAVYSVAAHYLSNTIREIKNVFEAYLIGAEIAGICLNMPWRFFAELRVPDSFAGWGARNKALKRNCDRGFLYAALIRNHPEGLQVLRDLNTWIADALKASGLPPLAEVNKAVQEDDRAVTSVAVEGPVSNRLRDLLEVGRPYLIHLCEPRKENGVMVDPATPPVLMSDGNFVSLPLWPNQNSFAVPGAWHETAFRCYTMMEQFLDACVV